MTDAPAWRARVADGSTVAVGGAGLNRKPMGLIRHLVDARDLVLVSFLGSVDVDLLIAADAVNEVHTAGTSLDGMGLAPRYRIARQTGSPSVIEWSEGSLAGALEASARGLGSMPVPSSLRSDIVEVNPWLRIADDPFTGEPVVHVRALRPDVALVQGSAVDARGNIHIDGDPAIDALVAKAARRVVVSVPVEEDRDPARAALSRVWVDEVVLDPQGPWPTGSGAHMVADVRAVGRWIKAGGEDLSVLAEVPS